MKPFIKKEKKGRILSKINSIDEGLICLHPLLCMFLCSSYTCQLFLRCKREIFILGVLGFLKTTRSFPKIPEEVRSLPKTSEVFRRRPKSAEVCQRRSRSQCFSLQKSEIARKVLPFINFTHGFRSLHGNCVKQDGNNSHFSIRREKLARRREPA